MSAAGRDLRSWLDTLGPNLARISAPTRVGYEMTALQHALDEVGRFPVLLFERPVMEDGRISPIPVLTNLTASRTISAAAMGIEDHCDAGRILAKRAARSVKPVIVEQSEAPVQEVVIEGEALDLPAILPALTQHVGDPGPYLTAAHATTIDPDTGTDNTAIQRAWVKGARETTYYPYPSSHNFKNVMKFWSRGEDAPIAFWIGAHPGVVIGTQQKLSYPASHWEACGALLGEPLRLVPTLTHGQQITVPADSEIVIEGFVPREDWIVDGPFGEFTGYLGPASKAMRFVATRLTMRRGAIYHDYGSGLTDMLVPDNIAMEGKLFALVSQVAPSLRRVYVPASGRRFHAYLQFENPEPGEARDALAAALSYRRVKTVIAVDRDVDVFDERAILWAMATRVQWGRDSFQIDGLSTSALDPSLLDRGRTGAKLAVDATIPAEARASFAPVARVPDEILAWARVRLAAIDPEGWPST